MKHEKKLTALAAAILAFVTAWGAVASFVSAFELPLAGPQVLITCIAAAGLCSFLCPFRRGGVPLLCLLALAGGYVWREGSAVRQLWQLIHHLTTIYDRAYGWGILILPEDISPGTAVDWVLGIWAVLIAASVSWSICRRESVWLPVLTTLLPLCACIVVTDTVPREYWLMMVMAGLILLILTSSVRQENGFQGLWLTAAAAPAVVLALTLLFLAIPQEGYVNHSEIFRENLLITVRNLPQILDTGVTQLPIPGQAKPQKQVDLENLGARIPFTYPVMTVTAEKSGTLYLRGQDYDLYNGMAWTASANREETFSHSGNASQTVTIVTEYRKDYRYLPYYPDAETSLVGGTAANPSRSAEYTVTQKLLPEDWRKTACQPSVNTDVPSHYLSLPEKTRQDVAELVAHLYQANASNTAKADIIAAFVMDSGRYDLNPDIMPVSSEDFALWFLREGNCGYCVHFATAATVLLRAAGIPARYVTGYMLEARAGEAVTVTEENAHAWAEYYEPNLGLWIPLEATPAAESSAPMQSSPTVPTQASEPENTAPSSVPETGIIPQPSTAPVPNTTPDTPPVQKAIPKLPLWFLWIPLLALILAVQRTLRLKLRHKRQHTGDPNTQALRRWQESVRLSRLLKESPTEELMQLAQKAKFSQYQLTQEELTHFDSFNRSCLRRLREKAWYFRLIHQYIYAAY